MLCKQVAFLNTCSQVAAIRLHVVPNVTFLRKC